MNNLTKLLSTFFYIGYSPLAPGSAASLAGVIICYILQNHPALYIVVWAIVTIAGFVFTGQMEKMAEKKDPSCVVIDEVSGMMIALFMLPFQWPVVISAFFLFRAFDMFKIYPSNKLEYLPGAAGIMLDDIVAGIYTNVVMQIAIRSAGIS